MDPKKFDLAANKFTTLSLVFAIIWFFSLLLKILFLNFDGIDIYWLIAAPLSFITGWLFLSKIISKLLCSLLHIILVALGLLILLFMNGYSFFAYLLQMLFFLIMIGLFANIFLDWQNGFRKMILICSAIYLLLMFLPIAPYKGIYLKVLFYWNFISYSPDVILFWIPFLIVLFLILEKILTALNKLPDKLQPLLIYRICFFVGLIYLVYYLIRQPASLAAVRGLSGFIGGFFANVFLYSICLTLGVGVLEFTENKLNRSLSFVV